MMAQFGVGTRRFVAGGLLVLAVLLAIQLIVSPLLSVISSMQDELELLKTQEARLSAARNWPERPDGDTRIDALLVGGGEAQARSAIERQLTMLASAQGLPEVRPNIIVEQRGTGRAYLVSLALSGPHDAIIGFVAAAERGRPLLRFRELVLRPIPGQSGELSAEMVIEAAGFTR